MKLSTMLMYAGNPREAADQVVAWERAGLIWYDTITAGTIPANADFASFATATADAASARYGDGSDEHRAVSWRGSYPSGMAAPVRGRARALLAPIRETRSGTEFSRTLPAPLVRQEAQ